MSQGRFDDPTALQRVHKLMNACLPTMCAVMVATFAAAIYWVKPASAFGQIYGSGYVAKVMFVHVPLAIVSFVAFAVTAAYSIAYLRQRNIGHDVRASASAELGCLFALLATITGAIWAKCTWGMYWNWDPRQITIVVVLATYGAYFALRSAIEDEEQRAIISAAYGVFALVVTFLNYFVLMNFLPSLHPQRVIIGRGSMGWEYRAVLFGAMCGFTLLYLCLLRAFVATQCLLRHIEIERVSEGVSGIDE